ncbi:MAG TPA: protein kinase, partial [Solirubrobacteraceae bacterium]
MPVAPDLCGVALNDRYELHALIGEGAFGRVYRGVDRRLARPVAVKVIKPWWSEDPGWVRRFERETQLLARVDDPGIVRIFDVGHAPEGLYYVAELVDGESLARHLGGDPVEPWEACELAGQLCRALAQAHAQSIVHRDVKPGNVLVSARGQVKVGDFGVAHIADASNVGDPTTIVGTPRYMAPEQGQGQPATPATDVYSVGVILYEMLAGRPPFLGTSPVELALSHLQEPPPPLGSDVPKALRSIVARALAKDPADRYADAGAMGRALTAVRQAPRGIRRVNAPRSREHGQPTWVAPRLAPRKNFNPAGHRRSFALLAGAVALTLGMVAVSIATGRGPQVRVPRLSGLPRVLVAARAAHVGLKAAFSSRYDKAPAQTAIEQTPPAGIQVSRGTTIRVVLSAGPPPVPLPKLRSETLADARTTLQSLGFHVSIAQVPAPGVAPQTVTGQVPQPGTRLVPGATVSLRVAEYPRWQPVASLQGDTGSRSGQFRIQGYRWRLRYSMQYSGTCTWVVFCSGPSATVAGGAGSSGTGFDLSTGSDQTQTFS